MFLMVSNGPLQLSIEIRTATGVTARSLEDEARAIMNRAEQQGRDLSDFESGRVDVLLDLAARFEPKSPARLPQVQPGEAA
jgi:plasmid stability protein